MCFFKNLFKIANLRVIKTAPTYLESTSLVVAYGLDLFFARVSPSGTFDLLDPDFNYYALILTTVTVVVLTIISSFWAKKNTLNKLWK